VRIHGSSHHEVDFDLHRDLAAIDEQLCFLPARARNRADLKSAAGETLGRLTKSIGNCAQRFIIVTQGTIQVEIGGKFAAIRTLPPAETTVWEQKFG
jgi:hypothetical protein